MKNRLRLFIFSGILLSCSTAEKQVSPKEKFDQLENVFSTANWKKIEGTDTSYLYFSRLGDLTYNVYGFTLVQGDSSLHELSTIRYSNKEISWEQSADTLTLVSSDTATLVWNSGKPDKTIYRFEKKSDNVISADLPGNKKATLLKTLPLATFLVRSRYDYLNNTHTVDSPLVPPRGKPLK